MFFGYDIDIFVLKTERGRVNMKEEGRGGGSLRQKSENSFTIIDYYQTEVDSMRGSIISMNDKWLHVRLKSLL